MSSAVRSRYLRLLVPALLVLLVLSALCWFLGGSGILYSFRKPVQAGELRLEDLEGSYFTVPADTLASQTFAYLGYTDGEDNTVIEERFCYLIVEGKYLRVKVGKEDVAELEKYEDGLEMVANGVIGSMMELQFADLSGTVVRGEDRNTRDILIQWITTKNISTDRQGVTKDSATGRDLSQYAETGDYTAYLNEVILPYQATIGFWGNRSQGGARTLAVLALVLLILAVLLLVSVFLGVWEKPYRAALRKWGKTELRQDFRKGVRFGRHKNLVLGEKYVWWLRTFSSRVMPVEEVLWVYPRSRRLEGGKKDWSMGLRSETENWSVRMGELSEVHQAMEAIREKGHPLAVGFDKDKQKLFEKDLVQFKAKIRNGTI
jgi:hypothetical protein